MQILYICSKTNDNFARCLKELFKKTVISNNPSLENSMAFLRYFDIIFISINLENISAWEIYRIIQRKKIIAKVFFIGSLYLSHERINELHQNGITSYIRICENEKKIKEKITTLFE